MRYQPKSASAAAWRGFINVELANGRASDKLGQSSCRGQCLIAEPKGQCGGAPGGIRTPNPQIRSLMLYPVELRAHPSEISRLSAMH